MDWQVGVLYYLRVVKLMCTRCVTVDRFALKKATGLQRGGETYSKIKYLSSKSVVGMASARWIA